MIFLSIGYGILAIAALGLLVYIISVYRHASFLEQQCERHFKDVDAILKERSGEIPQLVELCKRYTGFDNTSLRALQHFSVRYDEQRDSSAKTETANALTEHLGRLLPRLREYPKVNESEAYQDLADRLAQNYRGLLEVSEQYNDDVHQLNEYIRNFPHIIIALMANIRVRPRLTFIDKV